nr:hypothetical protein TetV2_00297 [Oceanusvirus sp.]
MSVAGLPTIVQHVNHLAARVQAIVFRIDALSEEIGELRQNVGGGEGSAAVKPDDLTALREDIKRDVIRERAMMEASLDSRITQQAKTLITKPSDDIARVEGRLEALESRVSGMGTATAATPARRPPAAGSSAGSRSKGATASASTMDLDAPADN